MMCNQEGLIEMVCRLGDLFSIVVPVLVGLGVVYFVWGVVQYVIADDVEAKSKGKDRIIFGIIGLAVIVSLWGLVFILTDTFFGVDAGMEGAPDFQGLLPE